MSSAHLPAHNPQVLFTELDDGTGVLLHLDTKFYYTLNPTAVVVWKAIGEDPAGSVAAVAQRLTARFKVEADIAERDIEGILREMLADGLLLAAEG